jgi:hypothetical protein
VLQDAFAEEEQHRCDFALLIFLEGWASQVLGDSSLAAEAYDEVRRLRPDFETPPRCHNVLVIAETGTSPRKLADGVGHHELVYRRGKGFSEQRAEVAVGGDSHEMYPIEDVAWQAMTRGGRPVDRILKGQVVFRQTHERIGTTLTDVAEAGMIAAPAFHGSTGDIQAASAALGLIGVAELAIAVRARPRADTRYWRSLPDTVHVFTCEAPHQDGVVDVRFLDGNGSEIAALSHRTSVHWPDGRHGLAWARSRSAALTD